MATDIALGTTTTVGQQITQLLGGGAASQEASASSGTEDRFLKLLVAQMRNQDPLNPLDNAQVTTQMAQISTVQGIEALNQTVKGSLAQFGQASPLDALGLIGRHVLAEGNTVERLSASDGAVRAGFELGAPADQVQARILAADGRVMFTRAWGPTEAGMQLFEWNGKDPDGVDAPAGLYRIEVVANSGKDAAKVTPLAPIRVLGISPGAEGAQIELAGQRAVSPQDIKAIL